MDQVLAYIRRSNLGDVYLDDPRSFQRETKFITANPEPERQAFFTRPWVLKHTHPRYDVTWVLLGALAALIQSRRIIPLKPNENMTFMSNSANGSFVLYESVEGGVVFMKIVTDLTADAIENDSVILRTLYEKANAMGGGTHFSKPLMSTRILLDYQGGDYVLDWAKVADPIGGFYGDPGSRSVDVAAFATTAATPGFSLGHVICALTHAFNFAHRSARDPSLIQSERSKIEKNTKVLTTFFRSALASKLYTLHDKTTVYDFYKKHLARVENALKERLMKRIAMFAASMLTVGKRTLLAHGDLHTNNVLYDMFEDTLVAIDFGRAYVDLRNDALVQVEHDKLMSRAKRGIPVDAEHFYEHFAGHQMRDPNVHATNVYMKQYNVMNDLAGLSWIVYEELFMMDSPLHEGIKVPFMVIDTPAQQKVIVFKKDLRKDVEVLSTLDPDDTRFALYPGLLWFAVYLHALVADGYLTYQPYVKVATNEIFYIVRHDAVLGDSQPLWFAGQFMPEYYNNVAKTFEQIMAPLQFFKHLEEWLEKVRLPSFSGGFLMPKRRQNVPHGSHTTPTKPKQITSKPFLPSPPRFTLDEIREFYSEHRNNEQSIFNAKRRKPKSQPKKKKLVTVPQGAITELP